MLRSPHYRSSARGHRLPALIALIAALLALVATTVAAAAGTIVTPSAPDGWHDANVRADASVAITAAQPRGAAPNNLGSLEFTTNTVTSGQDKADYAKYWGVLPGRTLGNLSALSYEFFRASASTTAQHFAPAFRLAYSTTDSPPKTGYLIWENVYNGGSTSTPVPTDQWISNDIFAGNFWMRTFNPGFTVEHYDVTLAQWQAGVTFSGSHQLGPDTNIVGVEVGVGSGWGNSFHGFVDTVMIGFGGDTISANFEPDPVVTQCTTDCYVDPNGDDANGGTSFAEAKKTIQAGVNQVSSGGTVHVGGGVYNEDLLIAKPLTLEGVQHGVLAKGRAGAQAIVQATGAANPVDIQADDVTIDGFVFDGSAATSRPWIITALSGPGNGRYEHVVIRYNEFKGNPGSSTFPGGMYLLNHDDLIIEGNYFNALGQHAVFLAGSSANAVYRNNDSYRNYNSNISTQDNTASGHQNILIENNRAVEDDMILFDMHGATVRNNTITGGSFSASRIWLGGGSSDVTISGNSFSALKSTAVQVFDGGFGYGPNSNITVTGNTINTTVANQVDNYSLIDLRDVNGTNLVDGNSVTLSGSYAAGGSATYAVGVRGSGTGTITITNNEFNGGNVASTGTPPSSAVLIRSNSANGALTSSAVLTVANNNLKNFSNGLAVYQFVAGSYGGLANGVSLTVNQNSITGNSANGVITGANDPQLNAESNWWGANTGPANAGNPGGTGDSVVGNVDFDPWLCSGQDTSGNTGFQPNPQTSPCVAPTGSIAVTKYNDLDRDGTRDGNEPGLSGWAITVKQGSTTVASGNTGADGSITFANLAPASYTVCETQQGGWQNTDPSNGSGCKPASVTAGSTTTVLLGNAAIPATCKVYGVNEVNSTDSQFFTMTLGGSQPAFGNLGGVMKGYNIESLALHPSTGVLYAGSGDLNKFNQKAALYTVNTSTGALTLVGKTGLKELEALTFHPTTGVLWGWGFDKGLITINTSTGAATVVFASKLDAEGMAWSKDGSKLYVAVGKTLYAYDPVAKKLTSITTSLPGKVEALSVRPDGLLAMAVDNTKTLYAYDPVAKKEVKALRITTPYKNIEGLAWPAGCGS